MCDSVRVWTVEWWSGDGDVKSGKGLCLCGGNRWGESGRVGCIRSRV